MVDARIKPSSRLPGGPVTPTPVAARGMVDGSAFTADWLARMALEGRMYTANAGTGTAPITMAALYTATAPDLDMSVPSGNLVVVTNVDVQMEAYGSTLLFEVIAAYGKGGVIAPTSATTVTPVNHRLDLGNDSGVTIVSDGTGATFMTPSSSVIEFWRAGQDKVITIGTALDATPRETGGLHWSALGSGKWPILYATDGITRLNVHASAQGGTGFISVTFVKPPLVAE